MSPSFPAPTFRISVDHPALAGHFPNNPLVPGVVLLSRVISILQTKEQGGASVKGLDGVKFLAQVRPDDTVKVAFSPVRPGLIRFDCWRDSTLIATGGLELEVRNAGAKVHDGR